MAVAGIRKQYPGHAKRVMMGMWSFLRQFIYTKFVIVVDEDIDIRNWEEVIWAISTRMDPGPGHRTDRKHPHRLPRFRLTGARPRLQNGPRRHNQMARRNQPPMGPPISMSKEVKSRIDELWPLLGLTDLLIVGGCG